MKFILALIIGALCVGMANAGNFFRPAFVQPHHQPRVVAPIIIAPIVQRQHFAQPFVRERYVAPFNFRQSNYSYGANLNFGYSGYSQGYTVPQPIVVPPPIYVEPPRQVIQYQSAPCPLQQPQERIQQTTTTTITTTNLLR